ncbi:alpha/beta fold hydrolase [Mammaliicoccus stepanovicii]|uniref:Lipase n=1 Tax=Mammaliicoccus stepanovicii TaxID=643214 RepID=A0A240A1V6_9STAP|nr:alpha/beta hydrolase [Mammaliicoccus stepanovicii]PNZ71972.1 2-succinyl-6-hydroxy-2,4-cyclohexadiene-1-carboxylate synthase [Mammaliicoccus stepanovicii]GGI39337.1 alpha/beta hydrolase [Mammaliicoccus stepanovicii]SNV77130.1 lipase [Mammaliicoccus stepanovicii]
MLYYKTIINKQDAEWVTLLHGAGGSSTIWFKQMRYYRKHFNILLVDLRGHGKSANKEWKKNDSFEHLAKEVVDVLDYLEIEKTHIVGISLGTIVGQTMAQSYPERISTLVLGGAIINVNLRTKFLLAIGRSVMRFVPYMFLYKLFAYIIMPKKSHEESRLRFVNEAKKVSQKQFIKWVKLTKLVNPYLAHLQVATKDIPTLFIMGEEDYLFMPPVERLVKDHENFSIEVIQDAGHVCNIDQPDVFNEISTKFIMKHLKTPAI